MLRTSRNHSSFDDTLTDDGRIWASSDHSSELRRDKMRSMSPNHDNNFRSASKVLPNINYVFAVSTKRDRSKSVESLCALGRRAVPLKVTEPIDFFKKSDADIGKKGYAIAPRIINKQRNKLRSSILLVPDVDSEAVQCDTLSVADAPSVLSPYQEENTSMRKLIDTKKQLTKVSQVRHLFRYMIDRLLFCFFVLSVIVAYFGYSNVSTLKPIMIGIKYESEAATSKMLLLKEEMDKTQQILQSLKDEVSDLYNLNEELATKAETENRNQPKLRGTMQLIHKHERTTKDISHMAQTNIAMTEQIIALKDKIQRESRRKVVEK